MSERARNILFKRYFIDSNQRKKMKETTGEESNSVQATCTTKGEMRGNTMGWHANPPMCLPSLPLTFVLPLFILDSNSAGTGLPTLKA